jgi:hypothetical protein
MLWLNTHARARRRLSPYIDGQLSPRERTALESHLAVCDACRRGLDELRATISVVGGLADVESPRSFVITPRMLEQRVAAPSASGPPLATGMRLAGAGVALVLAVVLVGDLGVVGRGGGRSESDESRQAAEFRATDSDSNDAAGGAPAAAATGAAEEYATVGADRASPDDLAASGEKTEVCPSSAGEVGDAASSPTLEPAPVAPSAGELAACAPAAAEIAPETGTPVNADLFRKGEEDEVAAPADSTSQEDGGVSPLTLMEIFLGGALVALVGAIGIEYVLRRRAA